jgi:hypothetical protein
VLPPEHDEELFAKQRDVMQPLVGGVVGPAIYGGLELAPEQALMQVGGRGVADYELDAGVLGLQVGQQSDEIARADGTHDPKLQRGLLELNEARGLCLGLMQLPADFVEIGAHRLTELAQMGACPLAMEQEPTELVLKLLDGARQRRLGHVAPLGRAREVELLAEG